VGLGVGDLRAGDLLQWAAQRMARHSPGLDTGASWPALELPVAGLEGGITQLIGGRLHFLLQGPTSQLGDQHPRPIELDPFAMPNKLR
jgi:hypothetical protein